MIRLTNAMHEDEWIVPEKIIRIGRGNEAPARTKIYLQDGSYVVVTETRQEVARKVLEWQLAMIDYHHDIPSVKTKAMAELAKLAGLEEPK